MKRIRSIRRYASAIADRPTSEAINQLEERIIDAIDHEHPVATTRAAGFAPALSGVRTEVLSGAGEWVDLQTLLTEIGYTFP
jgi:hypothetical protein